MSNLTENTSGSSISTSNSTTNLPPTFETISSEMAPQIKQNINVEYEHLITDVKLKKDSMATVKEKMIISPNNIEDKMEQEPAASLNDLLEENIKLSEKLLENNRKLLLLCKSMIKTN